MAIGIVRIVLFILGYFITGASLMPLIRNDNWVFRVFEYPRGQKLVLNLVVLVSFLFVGDFSRLHDVIFVALLSANAAYLAYQVYPYTLLAKRQMKGTRKRASGKHVKLLVCNVYQDNREAERCLSTIRNEDPDIIILVETDKWWKSALSVLEESYPHRVLKPLDNTYGMLLYSRFELIDPAVKYLVEKGIPSIHTRVKLPAGDLFFLYCLHPQPPVPQENPRSTERDAELLMIAREAKACSLPVIVAGDLNDVAWSYTSELFMKVSGLLDPRRGRGFFNTFHARHWFLRWPLDHVFCSAHFQLVDLKRLPDIGSDHFPIFIGLSLNREARHRNEKEALHADSAEQEVADKKIAKAQ